MREILLVGISALLGYIIFSAFSTTNTPQEAFRRIIEQPQSNVEGRQAIELQKLKDAREARILELQNQDLQGERQTNAQVIIANKKFETEVTVKQINSLTEREVKNLELVNKSEIKTKDNATLIIIAFLLFLLMIIYLKYQKQLTQIEIEKENNYNEMIAKKEYAEKILMLLSAGNLTYDTEQKLLKFLDQINTPPVPSRPTATFEHPNPDIAQIGR